MKVQGPHYPLRKTAHLWMMLARVSSMLTTVVSSWRRLSLEGFTMRLVIARRLRCQSYGGGYSNRFRALTGHRPVATGSCSQVAACHALASGRRVRRLGELGSRSPRSASEDDIFFCPSVDLAAMRTGEFRCFDLGSGPQRFFDCLAGRR
jgi:hypothetical protein